MPTVTTAGALSAAAIAPPMKGAVQGVATTTASTPVKKLPVSPPRSASPLPADARRPPTSNTPDRFRPIANSSVAMAATNTGDWNWKPQPAWLPAARSASSRPASATKLSTTPAQ